MKSSSDRGITSLLSSISGSSRIIILLLFGLALIIIGGIGGSGGSTDVDEEERLSEVCSMMDGVGECHVMITYSATDPSRVYGVLVLCDGAEQVSVREKIICAISSLYGIGANRVEIQKINRKNE